MKRTYQPGSEKRKQKEAKKLREEKGKRTLDTFLQKQPKSTPSSNAEPQTSLEKESESGSADADVIMTINMACEESILSSENNSIVLCEERRERQSLDIDQGDYDVNDEISEEMETITSFTFQAGNDEEKDELCCNDPASWKQLDKKKRDLIILKGPPSKPETFPRDSFGRNFPKTVFTKRLSNGECVERDWLVWSKNAAALFCFPCSLFKIESQSYQLNHSKFIEGGMSDNWKKIYEKIKSHEANTLHLRNYIMWKELFQALKSGKGTVDEALQQNIKQEEEKWRKILNVVVDVILFLAQRNLPFRGNQSTVDCDDCGLFLSTLKLVGNYNIELKQHLEAIALFKNTGRRMQAHYLSWRSQNEFLELCGKKVLNCILEEVRKARYYSIIVDGTPDVSHTEQLVFIIRYVIQKNGIWVVKERFIRLTDFDKKTGADIADQLKKFLEDCDLKLSWCRGQGYDNASNMSGKFQGVKTRILEENSQAYFSPCSAHTLNLCGTHAMETSVEVKSYFGNVQKLYKVFALSPARWKILQTTANISLHSISKTRWSARVDAVRPLIKNYKGVLESLFKIEEELDLPAEIQADVNGLIEWLNSFEFVLLTTIWFKLLQCIDDRNKILQSSKLTMEEGTNNVNSLVEDIKLLKDSWLQLFEEAKQIASNFHIDPNLKMSRIRRKKKFFDDTGDADYTFYSTEIQFKVKVFLPAMDLLLSELRGLGKRMAEISDLFSPILCPKEDIDESSIEKYAEGLANAYPQDLQIDELKEEFRIFYKIRKDSKLYVDGHTTSAATLLNVIFDKGLEKVFPQLCISLRLLIVLPLSVASGERSFSKLTFIKNRLRSTTGEDRLNHLLTLSIEYELTKEINFDDIIDEFAKMKARKKKLSA